MTRARYGLLAGIAGAAFAAWYWRGHRRSAANLAGARDKGEVIFRNTPVPSSEGIL
jgi:hypothetical protein